MRDWYLTKTFTHQKYDFEAMAIEYNFPDANESWKHGFAKWFFKSK